ncbi:MAG: NAD-dependent epimerase/dehydratase family protein [Termitinemataceae bacterium]|nr:MAG: NAD-dependent epimerase/dehydratase family protein [Termitinemataceae bacterium]
MRYAVLGGAGFIGSHLTRELLSKGEEVTVFDNFSSGTEWHLSDVLNHENLKIIRGDIKDFDVLKNALAHCEAVYHFASNPDIAKAVTHPDVDFWEGTYLTNNMLEALRQNGIVRLIYASGSGVYGECGTAPVSENFPDMRPISTYGASKLACEALICSYCFMFGLNAAAFRFANVVGPRQTHGVGYDFINRLREKPATLKILGDGTQDKSYIHVEDIVAAIRLIETRYLKNYDVYNVATLDSVTVTKIADMARNITGSVNTTYDYSGGDRGWKGDVPVIRMNSQKIRALGWTNRYTSEQALFDSMSAMFKEVRA